MDNNEVNDIFNQIKFIIFSNFENNNKNIKNLIPLNNNNIQTRKKNSCEFCCTIC
jgi:hypothetical protein